MRDLGNRAVSNDHSVVLSCTHCDVSWNGCAAESCCPECGTMKGYHSDDLDHCYCQECDPENYEPTESEQGLIPIPDGYNEQ